MSGEHALEERLRTQLDRWAQSAFPDTDSPEDSAPGARTEQTLPMPEPLIDEPRRRHTTTRTLVAASVVVIVAAGAFGLVKWRQPSSPSRSATVAQRDNSATALIRVEWRFASFVTDGERWSVPSGVDARLRFDGAGHFSASACNDVSGPVTIEGETLHFGREQMRTLVLCQAGIDRRIENAVNRLISSTATWTVSNDTLRLVAPGATAELTRPASTFPTRDLVVLASSARDRSPGQWQLGYQPADKTLLHWEGRSDPGTPFGFVGVRINPTEAWGTAVSVGSVLVVLGYLPDATASARYVVQSRPAIAVTLYKLPGRHPVFGQSVSIGGGEVVAYDSSGNEVARTRALTS